MASARSSILCLLTVLFLWLPQVKNKKVTEMLVEVQGFGHLFPQIIFYDVPILARYGNRVITCSGELFVPHAMGDSRVSAIGRVAISESRSDKQGLGVTTYANR